MLNKILIIIIIMLCSGSFSLAEMREYETFDFLIFKWKDSKERIMDRFGKAFVVKLNEKGCAKKHNCMETLTYEKNLRNALPATIVFYFINDELYKGRIIITNKHILPHTAMFDFDMMIKYINTGRGVSISNTSQSLITLSDDVSPNAIARGKASKFAVWDKENDQVFLVAEGIDGKIQIIADFIQRECCSKHGGVCGCECCDRTILELDKCSGSYPGCK